MVSINPLATSAHSGGTLVLKGFRSPLVTAQRLSLDPEHSESSLVLGEGPKILLVISQILSLNLGPLGKIEFWKKSPHSPLVTSRITSLDLRSPNSISVLDERFMAIAQSESLDLAPLTLAHTGSVSEESGSAHQKVARAPRLPLPMVL